ncbi:septal ring lytic transglycosylase RlpA family protein [Desulfoluna spongiiphila]|uniref:Probable endolytic peptidoglycan transglycosylase RlpA n=1 Tax=Desulfoluna spongiiphila TaxID=419481 RepID=A0A1G5CYE4_9BACT|nr:septal ring lytic transglycosylase RlpA family protein [Desulfoluna spongiiphila]SCY07513.1 rare lipoprotein A [Desulfoluna spongiiphila]VVS92486.1 endolytic peptidoglycan transglycosylase rlpa [Desulfoluna spongiiphila]
MNRTGHAVYPLLLAALLLFTSACATKQSSPPARPANAPRPYKVLGKWYQPLATSEGYDEVGIASWYGPKFHGKPTASGETYDMHAMTAAHKTLPLGTRVRVKHLGNGKEVTLKINDRGPFVGKRIIDLSNKAAHAIGMVGTGTAKVRVTALKGPKTAATTLTRGDFGVQVGAFGDRSNAESYAARLSDRYANLPVKAVQGSDGLNRVVVGRLLNREAAVDLKLRLMEDGFTHAFILSL